jgi:C4-dicarboxylate transporter DctM subunit
MSIAWVLFGTLIILLLLRVPVSFSLALSAAAALLWEGYTPLLQVVQRMYAGANSWLLLAIPFFMLAGQIMEKGGVTKRLVDFADSLVGFLPGGLSAVNIVVSMFFGGVSGSAVADTSAVGSILIPAMTEQGYSKSYSAAVTASSSPIGIIIPPSIPLILYGFVAGLSIAELFLAGIGAGILVGLAEIIVSTIISIKRGYRSSSKFSLKRVFSTGYEGMLALLAPLIIIGGIITGWFTPTEAAAIAVVYTLFLGFFVFKDLKIRDIPEVVTKSMTATATVMLVISAAAAFAWVLSAASVPQNVANYMVSVFTNPTAFLFALIAMFLILGTFLDANAAMLLVVPVIAPAVQVMGLDPIHVGVVLTVTLGVGLVTPPVGLCVFIASSITGLTFEQIIPELIPFVLALLVCILLLVFIPEIALLIPSLVAG